MGRKGVSKRKPTQTKSKPFSSDPESGSVSSAIKAAESQAVKSVGTGKAGVKPAADWTKKSKKG